jgi:glycosyltransferase involved in cell wall biosynthesis
LLRIGFDGRALTSPAGGVRRYASELLAAMTTLDAALELVIIGGDPSAAVPARSRRVPEPWHPPTNAGWSIIGLPRAAKHAGIDVLHAPAYTGPFWSPVPVVLTVHDVSYARHPEWFPYRRDAVRRAFYRRCALSATSVITVSQFSASEIHAAYGIATDRIAVVPHGVSAEFGAAAVVDRAILPDGVTPPFLLHVGDLHERRNLSTVVDALFKLRSHGGAASRLQLVMAGVDRGVGDALNAQARAAGAPGAVVLLGAVDEVRLRTLYRSALALVYPSRYEGFGLPLLEAMAAGLPVIASRAASIPEVLGDAGLLLEPLDGSAWAAAIERVASDADVRQSMRSRGIARAAQFTWKRTAELTLDVYRQVARA